MAGEEKVFSQEESASIPKSVISRRSCSQHCRNRNFQDPPALNMRITLSFFLMTANNAVQVFINKQLFKKELLSYAQVTFSTFHFTVTSLALLLRDHV
jgi:hypothetical protein